ncbi:MAG: hypothetical protein HGN29_08295 [Asgard group archaeon]|nr:hypothetical protein [Asgard group archaeon]
MKHTKTNFVLIILLSSLFFGISIQQYSSLASRDINFSFDTISSTSLEYSADIVPPANGKAEHWAIIVGISDYKAISDLGLADDDATDWYLYLTELGYEHILLFGDDTSYYPQLDGLATEYNVKQALCNVIANAGENDVISFMTSGHGSTDHKGGSFLCMWDLGDAENDEDGRFWDYELASILELAIAESIFIFIDHCFAGGFGPDLMNLTNSEYIYFAAACTTKGMGWDAPEFNNGLWTYYFLEFTLIDYFNSKPRTTMEEAFAYASANFPYHTGVMIPEEYDGNLDQTFQLI